MDTRPHNKNPEWEDARHDARWHSPTSITPWSRRRCPASWWVEGAEEPWSWRRPPCPRWGSTRRRWPSCRRSRTKLKRMATCLERLAVTGLRTRWTHGWLSSQSTVALAWGKPNSCIRLRKYTASRVASHREKNSASAVLRATHDCTRHLHDTAAPLIMKR